MMITMISTSYHFDSIGRKDATTPPPSRRKHLQRKYHSLQIVGTIVCCLQLVYLEEYVAIKIQYVCDACSDHHCQLLLWYFDHCAWHYYGAEGSDIEPERRGYLSSVLWRVFLQRTHPPGARTKFKKNVLHTRRLGKFCTSMGGWGKSSPPK